MSPTACFLGRLRLLSAAVLTTGMVGRGGVYPGYGMAGWGREGYTGTQPYTLPGPIFNHILRIGPTHGQMKPNLVYL